MVGAWRFQTPGRFLAVKQGVISRDNKLKSAVMWMSLMSDCYWWCLVSQRIEEQKLYPPITYYCTGLLILDHSYLVGNLTNPKIAETKALEPIKSWHFCISNFRTCWFPNDIWVVQDWGHSPIIGDRRVQPCSEFHNFRHGSKAISSNASSGSTGQFLGGDDRNFLKEGVETYQMAPMSPLQIYSWLCTRLVLPPAGPTCTSWTRSASVHNRCSSNCEQPHVV